MPLGIGDLRVQEELARRSTREEAVFSGAASSGKRHADFDFGGVQAVSGIFSKLSLYVNLPDYVVPQDSVLRLSYTASDLILQDISSLTFYMNGIPFASRAIIPSVESYSTVDYISVPADLLHNGYNLLEIEAYVRLTDDEGCRDDYNGANWIKINEPTCLRVIYDVVEDTSSLALFPFPFLSIMDKMGAGCAVTVSDAADASELTAAMMLMAGLGNEVPQQSEIELCRIGETDRQHVIYLGLQQNTQQELLDLLGQPVPNSGALVSRAQKDGREYLLVIAREKAALTEAVRYLADSTRVKQTQASSIHISVGEAQSYIDALNASGLTLQGQYTLRDILGHGASFYGPFHQEMIIYLPLSQDYALSSEGRFSLNIRYSENLDFDRSMMTVYWGSDIPLYSHKLTQEGAGGETVTFAVPADAAGKVSTSMMIAFELEMKDLDCTPRQLNMPWAYVAEDSTLYLPQGQSSSQGLDTLPVPFQKNKLLSDFLMVLPDYPEKAELVLAGRVMNMLGQGSVPYGSMRVLGASDFDSTMYDHNLLIVGTGENNALLRKINDSLFFQFTDDFSAVASNDKLILDSTYAATVGTLQIIASPFAQGRSALVVSAAGPEGLQSLTSLVSKEKNRWSLSREAVLVDGRGTAVSYQFTSLLPVVAEEKPTFTQIVAENQEPMLMMLIGLGCMFLVLLTVVIVLIRIRANKRDEE